MTTMKRTRISEGSCWQCKKRRIRCDLTKPSCTKCQESSEQECSYGAPPLKWIGGMAVRGRYAPHQQRVEGVCTLASPPSSSSSSETFSSTSLVARRNFPVSLPPTPGLTPLETSSLFEYFSVAVLPRFQVIDEHIPVERHVANKDKPLQQAILAVARAHHSFLSKSNLGGNVMVRNTARLAAINSFRRRLEQGSDTIAQDLFCINVLFCVLDGMIAPERDLNASMFHLKGGYAMLERWPNTVSDMLTENSFQSHLLSVFTTMDLIHAILSGSKPYFEPTIWSRFADKQAWWGRRQSNDAFLVILEAHSQVAILGHAFKSGGDLLLVTDDGLDSVEALLLVPTTCDQADWKHFCDFYVLSCSIFFQRVVRKRAIQDEVIQTLVRRGVTLFKEVLPGMMNHCVVLPMLVIGAHSITAHDRQIVREALSPSLSYLSFGNMVIMADYLRTTWQKHDMDANWWEMFHDIADKVFLF